MQGYDYIHGNILDIKCDIVTYWNLVLGVLGTLMYVLLFLMIGYTNMAFELPVSHTIIESSIVAFIAYGGALKIAIDEA